MLLVMILRRLFGLLFLALFKIKSIYYLSAVREKLLCNLGFSSSRPIMLVLEFFREHFGVDKVELNSSPVTGSVRLVLDFLRLGNFFLLVGSIFGEVMFNF